MTERKYKTGDKHPEHNMLAFVRYDDEGREEWTSVLPRSYGAFSSGGRK